jgi:transcriptional regulator with XRE-family HTH domain
MENLGKRLQRLRLKSNLSQSELANCLGVSPSTYRGWELGRLIKGEPYVTLAKLLNVSLNELMTGKKSRIDLSLDLIEESVKNIRHCL